MSISDLRRAGVAALLAAVIALIASPSDPAMHGVVVHPAWLVALVIAARYGSRGLLTLPAVIAGVAVAQQLAAGDGLSVFERFEQPEELATLTAVVLVAWVGELHEARKRVLEARRQEADERASEATRDLASLAQAAIVLRERGDRALSSLTFLTDIALELESKEPARIGRAALDLAVARTGARGGLVQLVDGARLRTLVERGAWSHDHIAAPVLFRDRVAVAALERGVAVAAHEVAEVRMDDSDLAAPLIGEDGVVHGVLALRGIAYPKLAPSARADLVAIARWAARSLAGSDRGAGPAAQRGFGRARA
jgi:hypothetical protein